MKEQDRHSHAHFITLTYDNRFVPISPNGFMTLDKSAFPLFMKRLRKRLGVSANPVRYYACGEYGSKTHRPHYHAIVFGVPDPELFHQSWTDDGVQIGTVHVGNVSGDSVAYCMKYIDKSNFKANHGRDDRVPEFALMSKGLGSNYLTPAVLSYHHADWSRMCLVKEDGHKIAMPRYYRSRIYSDDDSGFQRSIIQHAMDKKEQDNFDRFSRLYGDSNYTYEEFVDSQRMARYKSFYSNQSSRDGG
ncbi:MAG: replication initiator protein [Microviridae sp.]|nr:MAG: replication initiator protein [Microviridae sp.]